MKPQYLPPLIVAVVGLVCSTFIWYVSTFGLFALLTSLTFTAILAWVVKPKEQRVFDGDNIDDVVKVVDKVT